MFLDSLQGGGSHSMSCGWCQREHLCPDNIYADSDRNNFDTYKEFCENEYKNNPETVVLHYDCDCVIAKDLNGVAFVLDCPCNGMEMLAEYEAYLWEYRNSIKQYFDVRTKQESQWHSEETVLNKLAGK